MTSNLLAFPSFVAKVESMSDKKNKQPSPSSVLSPPSHPTTLGTVWIGETRPTVSTLDAVLTSAVVKGSEKPRHE